MVDMAMGEDDLLDLDLVLRRGRLQPVEIAARIDDRPAHRPGAPEKGGILLERGHRHDDGLERGSGHRRQMARAQPSCNRARGHSKGAPP
jgi:hypothetical protein